MQDTIMLTGGIIILALTIYDFFFTTLSGSGASFITRMVSFSTHKVIKLFVSLAGRKVYTYSGLTVNLLLLFVWVVLIWLGLYLVFSSDPDAIVDTKNIPAGNAERLYYTGFTLSTLGMGDYKPITASFKILTGVFSFFGFVFFTTSMTYLMSVSSALIHKRSMVLKIADLGNTPFEIRDRLNSCSSSYAFQAFSDLQDMINTHSVNYQSYPVLGYYTSSEAENAFTVNLARLDEAVSLILITEKGKEYEEELMPLRYALSNLLAHVDEKFSRAIKSQNPPDGVLPKIQTGEDEESIAKRRRTLSGLLKSESLSWESVYPKI